MLSFFVHSGKDKDAWKILVNIWNIQQISDITFHNYNSKDISKTNEPKRYSALYLNETDIHYAVGTYDSYAFSSMLLNGEKLE